MTERRQNRQYTPSERAEAVGLAVSIGSVAAAKRLGIPRRTISAWLGGETKHAELAPAIAASKEQIAEKLWTAVQVGTDAVLAGLNDPKARLGDKARALEIVAEQHALLTGGVTARSEVIDAMTPEMAHKVDEWATAVQRQGEVMMTLPEGQREALWSDIQALWRRYFGADFVMAVAIPPGLVEPAAPIAEPPPSADDIEVVRAWLAEQDAKAGAS